MKNQINIIELSKITYGAWFKLWTAYQSFYQTDLSAEVSQNTWSKLINSELTHIYGYAAVVDSEVAGIVHVIEHDSCWTVKPYAYLQDLYTHADFRGKGIAGKLIAHVYEQAMQRQCDRVYWLTHQDNETAQRLYDKVARKTGFIQYRM
ncbi:MAG: GNAT family N-acetyltransferase [Acinetobacter sp.]|nr:GNAT family N-acetyltransferase [Acinetobacter sp.]